MKITLSQNREFVVGVKHSWIDPGSRRCTIAWLKFADSPTLEVKAVCGYDDNFCKRVGRRLAANRLLARVRVINTTSWFGNHQILDKEDRRLIFLTICPEYKNHSKIKRSATVS